MREKTRLPALHLLDASIVQAFTLQPPLRQRMHTARSKLSTSRT